MYLPGLLQGMKGKECQVIWDWKIKWGRVTHPASHWTVTSILLLNIFLLSSIHSVAAGSNLGATCQSLNGEYSFTSSTPVYYRPKHCQHRPTNGISSEQNRKKHSSLCAVNILVRRINESNNPTNICKVAAVNNAMKGRFRMLQEHVIGGTWASSNDEESLPWGSDAWLALLRMSRRRAGTGVACVRAERKARSRSEIRGKENPDNVGLVGHVKIFHLLADEQWESTEVF